MPTYTITLSQAAADRLQELVDDTNAATNGAYDLAAWVTLHLNEMAIQKDLVPYNEAIQPTIQREVERQQRQRVAAERARLLAAIEDKAVPQVP